MIVHVGLEAIAVEISEVSCHVCRSSTFELRFCQRITLFSVETRLPRTFPGSSAAQYGPFIVCGDPESGDSQSYPLSLPRYRGFSASSNMHAHLQDMLWNPRVVCYRLLLEFLSGSPLGLKTRASEL